MSPSPPWRRSRSLFQGLFFSPVHSLFGVCLRVSRGGKLLAGAGVKPLGLIVKAQRKKTAALVGFRANQCKKHTALKLYQPGPCAFISTPFDCVHTVTSAQFGFSRQRLRESFPQRSASLSSRKKTPAVAADEYEGFGKAASAASPHPLPPQNGFCCRRSKLPLIRCRRLCPWPEHQPSSFSACPRPC